ncbi:hypothetical protein EV426DRAFT_710855 [Tirmania nivea]|nr:hypothetical protein EV426DRAFT_710855 [Tirmania nivea]
MPSDDTSQVTGASVIPSPQRLTLRQRHAALRASNIFWNPNPDPHADDRAPNFSQFVFSDWEMEQEFYNPLFYKDETDTAREIRGKPSDILWNILFSVAVMQVYACITKGIFVMSRMGFNIAWAKAIVMALFVLFILLIMATGFMGDLEEGNGNDSRNDDGDEDDNHDSE